MESDAGVLCAALVVTVIVSAILLWRFGAIGRTLGDTDDAMRLVLVRDLMTGRGWWDQLVTRLQPPVGVYMHWSRLIDGGLAALTWMFERVLPPAQAEYATRLVWPLMWIAPAAWAMLSMARSLGGRAAIIATAVLLVIDTQAFVQFRPGRVDHHNVQIAMALIAAAAAMAGDRRRRWGVVAGVASALGLAVGIEALPFHALIGASFALYWAIAPEKAPATRSYGLSLAFATAAFFMVQTPPWRWSMSFCDALAFNLAVTLVLAGLGLAAAATWAAAQNIARRIGLIGTVGAGAVATYLGLDPACLHGPFGAVDPRMRSFWFDRVQELAPWPRFLRLNYDWAVLSITAALMTLAAAIALVVVKPRAQPNALVAFGLTAAAAVCAANALRMHDYVYGFGLPALGAAFGLIAGRVARGGWRRCALSVAIALALAPANVGWALAQIGRPPRPSAGVPMQRSVDCYASDVYRALAAQPPGIVLGEINLGPFILAETRDSVLAAPYHRMSLGIMAAHEALGAAPTAAEAKVRALNVTYVVACAGAPLRVGPGSLEVALRRGQPPSWLSPLSPPGQVLQIYRLRPSTAARGS